LEINFNFKEIFEMKKVTGSLAVILVLCLCGMVSASEKASKPVFDAPTAYVDGRALANKIANSDLIGKEEAAKDIEAILFDLLQKNRKK
jgi:hypothetical protein